MTTPYPSRLERIRDQLYEEFSPTVLDVRDDSGRHRGHMGARPEGETHFSITIVSEAFSAMSKLQRHRAINAALKGEFSSGLHALSITARAPGEGG